MGPPVAGIFALVHTSKKPTTGKVAGDLEKQVLLVASPRNQLKLKYVLPSSICLNKHIDSLTVTTVNGKRLIQSYITVRILRSAFISPLMASLARSSMRR